MLRLKIDRRKALKKSDDHWHKWEVQSDKSKRGGMITVGVNARNKAEAIEKGQEVIKPPSKIAALRDAYCLMGGGENCGQFDSYYH